MAGRVQGKTVLISGAARGQGRSHAVRLAAEGAGIVAFDICRQIESVAYPMSTPEDLAETVRLVDEQGGKIVARQADVRDPEAVARVVAEGIEAFGHIDCVLANAGIMPFFPPMGDTQQAYQDCVDVMLTGVYNTLRAAVPSMIGHGTGGSIVITSSIAGLKPRTDWAAGSLGYTVAKAGVIGLMRLTALRLGQYSIRCNTVHPTGVRTGMVDNEPFRQWTRDAHEYTSQMRNALPVEIMEPADVSNLMVFLCSDESRYLTGETISIDAGYQLT